MWRYTSAGVGRLERVVARASASGAPWRHIRRQLAAAAAAASSSPAPVRPAKQIRNIAVVAHVDHGKTTLVNQLLKAGGIEIKGDEDRLLDSLELESERGITIMSKATRIDWGDHQLNIVDTPGHQDFGGEVERVLSMVDGALVLVDALEGVRPQTKFVVGHALQRGLKIVLCVNKCDRAIATAKDRLEEGQVENEMFDLLCALNADDEQLEYSTLYASAKQGWAVDDPSEIEETMSSAENPGFQVSKGMEPLLRELVSQVPAPSIISIDGVEGEGDDERDGDAAPFRFTVNNLAHDQFIGTLLTGKVHSGSAKVGDSVRVLPRGTKNGVAPASSDSKGAPDLTPDTKITHVFCTRGASEREDIGTARAGDIVTIAGVSAAFVADSVTGPEVEDAVDTVGLTPPTVAMNFGSNSGPLFGKSGAAFVNSNQIKDRLRAEVMNNVTVSLRNNEASSESMDVLGKGELQLGILVESMRREGYEMCLSPPQVLLRKAGREEAEALGIKEGALLEPVEEVVIDCDQEHAGLVIERMAALKGEMQDFKEMPSFGGGGSEGGADKGGGDGGSNGSRARLIFHATSSGLMGFRSALRTETRGSAVICSTFLEYRAADKSVGTPLEHARGRLIATEGGKATRFALHNIEPRGTLYISPGDEIYEGMVIGEHAKEGDLDVNAAKTKQLTNMRAAGKDEALTLQPPRQLSLEEMICEMREDEMLEVTPGKLRLRKRVLDAGERSRLAKRGKKARMQVAG